MVRSTAMLALTISSLAVSSLIGGHTCLAIGDSPGNDQANAVVVLEKMPTEGLLAWYPFDGNANDASGNGHHGKAHGAAEAADRRGQAKRAYQFDGRRSHVDIPARAIPAADGYTIAAWIKPEKKDSWGTVAHLCSAGVRQEIGLRVLNDLRIAAFDGTLQRLVSKAALANKRWHHVAMTVDASRPAAARFALYIDGRQDASLITPYKPNAAASVFSIGSFFHSARWFKGSIDDVAIYRRALPREEIQQLFRWRAR